MNKKFISLFTVATVLLLLFACGCTDSTADTAEAGDTVSVDYVGTFNNGTVFDESQPGEPLVFTLGTNSMITGFENAIYGMKVGETKDIHLLPEEAYGSYDQELIFKINRTQIPEEIELSPGAQLMMYGSQGDIYQVTVISYDDEKVEIDANHKMAGKELNFEVTLVNLEKGV